MPTDFEGMLPVTAARSVIASAQQRSAAMALGLVRPMPAGTELLPVVSAVPNAEFVAPGARKPVTKVEWSAATLKAEEIAATTYVPDVYLTDSGWDVEGSVETELGAAVARRLDAAVLWGQDPPASFPPGGVLGAAAQATGADALEAIDAGMSLIEASGLTPSGVASSTAISGALRAALRAIDAPPSQTPELNVYGLPVRTVASWPAGNGDAIVGDWQYLVIGIRNDISFERSNSATLFDDSGELVISAFQDDVTVVRVTFRVGCVLGQPVAADGGATSPFAAVSWTAPPAPPEPPAPTRSRKSS